MMSRASVIKVLLVDDHDILRGGLVEVLESFEDLELVGEAVNGLQAVQFCDKLQPDVILMDLVMPEMDGVTATRIIHQKHPNIRIIALTSFEEEKLIEGARQAGVQDYLLKNVTMDELADAIRNAYYGKSTISS